MDNNQFQTMLTRINELESENVSLTKDESRSRHHAEAMQITITIKDNKIKDMIKENTELKRQIKLFIDAENWGK